MWAIWTTHNKLLHEGQHFTASETMNLIKRYLGKVDGAKEKVSIEAMACSQATDMGLQLGLLRVEIEGDSLAVIQKLKEERVERSGIGAYICNIRTICERDQDCVFQYVSKNANGAAHFLATEGLRQNEETYLAGAVPSYA
ncbi:hypothetical protein PVK06_040094 [Gossypium arboreum]|uniref:RNase H type-1 domain-containing protein n=1 Tax=Gossypium arboreum TaxID=29729 RepID=A0ABR0N5B2_GOSAR|nr:hypothetical protein PVK06_040094 [Gossypium arboreum]